MMPRGLPFWLSVVAIGAGLLGLVSSNMVLAAGLAVGALWLAWFVVGLRGGGLGGMALGLLGAAMVLGIWSGDLGSGDRGGGLRAWVAGSGSGVSGPGVSGSGVSGVGASGSGSGVLGFGLGAGTGGSGCGGAGSRVVDLDDVDLGRCSGGSGPSWGAGRWALIVVGVPLAALVGFILMMRIVGTLPIVGRTLARWVALRIEPYGRLGLWVADQTAPDRLSNIIVPSDSGAHGTDRLMTDAEALAAWGGEGEDGFILGVIGDRVLRYADLGAVLVQAAPDAGKTSSYIIPALLSPSTESRVIVDVKGELIAKTGGYRQTLGQRLLVVDPERITPFGAGGMDARINLLTCIPGEGETVSKWATLLAQALLPREGKSANPYFELSATELLEGLILWVRLMPEELLEGRPRDLVTVREYLHRTDIRGDIDKQILPHLDKLEPHLRSALEGLLAPFVDLGDDTWGSMPQQAKQALKFLDLPGWQRSLCARGEGGVPWAFSDLYEPGTDLYLCVQPGTLRAYPGAVRSLIAALTESLLAESIRRGGLNPKVRMLLDEVDTLGRCQPLIEAVTVGRPAVRPMFVIQGLSQLQRTYGREDADLLMTSVKVQVHFATGDAALARAVSDLSGSRTIRDRSMSGHAQSQAWAFSEKGRPVITPGEVVHLPRDKAILILPGQYAAIVTKARGWEDAPFAARYEMPLEVGNNHTSKKLDELDEIEG